MASNDDERLTHEILGSLDPLGFGHFLIRKANKERLVEKDGGEG